MKIRGEQDELEKSVTSCRAFSRPTQMNTIAEKRANRQNSDAYRRRSPLMKIRGEQDELEKSVTSCRAFSRPTQMNTIAEK
ncbi:hypothetical protein QWT36_23725, partial [Salmonella enterica subsp. enterica serovar Typhi]|nr:hypothetical protein [Salmonella enterica subsp. enterica serovar Typhi]